MSEIKETERQLKALANKRRLAILKFLFAKEPASVGSIAQEIKLSFKSTSRNVSAPSQHRGAKIMRYGIHR